MLTFVCCCKTSLITTATVLLLLLHVWPQHDQQSGRRVAGLCEYPYNSSLLGRGTCHMLSASLHLLWIGDLLHSFSLNCCNYVYLADLCRAKYLFRPRPGESLQSHQYYRQLYPTIVRDISVRYKYSFALLSNFICLNLFVYVILIICNSCLPQYTVNVKHFPNFVTVLLMFAGSRT